MILDHPVKDSGKPPYLGHGQFSMTDDTHKYPTLSDNAQAEDVIPVCTVSPEPGIQFRVDHDISLDKIFLTTVTLVMTRELPAVDFAEFIHQITSGGHDKFSVYKGSHDCMPSQSVGQETHDCSYVTISARPDPSAASDNGVPSDGRNLRECVGIKKTVPFDSVSPGVTSRALGEHRMTLWLQGCLHSPIQWQFCQILRLWSQIVRNCFRHLDQQSVCWYLEEVY